MSQTPPTFVRVSTPNGHFTVPAAVAERAGSDWTVLKQDAVDKFGRPLAPKPRTEIASTPRPRKRATTKPRGTKAAATPTKPEAPASVDSEE